MYNLTGGIFTPHNLNLIRGRDTVGKAVMGIIRIRERLDDYKYQQRIVAFLDILGFKETIMGEKEGDIRQIIQSIDSNLEHVFEAMKLEGGEWYSAKIFSDCICISCDNFGSNLYYMLNELSYLQFMLASEGLFIRGAVTLGLHFENERMIFSEALIKAYELEQKANYPRVVISDSVLELVSQANPHYCAQLTPFLMSSPDGACFLDYFQHIYEMWREHGIEAPEFLIRHKESVIAQIEKHKTNAYVLDKFKWVAEYHNAKIPDFYDPDDFIEEDIKEVIKEMLIPMSLFPTYQRYQRTDEGKEPPSQPLL
jgi:hypothetical protein